MKTLASVDLGTNTFRMLIAEQKESGLSPLRLERAIVRMGEGMHERGEFSPAAMERAISALKGFRQAAEEAEVEEARAVGTSAFREAKNASTLLQRIEEETGWEVEVISGRREAELTAKGAFLGLQILHWPVLLVDIGGGSTEYTLVEEGRILFTESTPLGVVHLTEGLITHDPPLEGEIGSLREKVVPVLEEVRREMNRLPPPRLLVGVAGTPTTIAALHQELPLYRHELVHGYQMDLREVESLTERLLRLTSSQRLALNGMEKGREDLIVAGAVLLEESMRVFGCHRLVVSDCGLLEGILLEMVEGTEAER